MLATSPTQNKGKGLAAFVGDSEEFLSVLEESGVWFASTGEAFLEAPPFSIRKRLAKTLKMRGHVANTVRNVMEGLIAFTTSTSDNDADSTFANRDSFDAIEERTRNLRSLLVDVKVCKRSELDLDDLDADLDQLLKSNASIIKIMLSVNELQNKLIDWIHDLILEFMPIHVPGNSDSDPSKNLCLLLLHQFRFLDLVVDPPFLTTRLVALLDSTHPFVAVQKLVIDVLPEILPDQGGFDVVEALKECMDRNPEVVSVVLDVLGTIGVPKELLVGPLRAETTSTVVTMLGRAEVDTLPVVIKFLLQTANSDSINNLIPRIRSTFDFDAIAEAINNADFSSAALIFDSLKMGILRQKYILDAWLKCILELDRPRNHQPIDVIVLTLLRCDLQTQKKVDSIFKSKVKNNLISPALAGETFKQYFVEMHQFSSLYYPTILGLCEGLVREDAVYHSVGTAMYCSSFLVFDLQNRQQLIGCLIAHIGSGIQHEVDCALNILLELTVLKPEGVLKFSIFIKGLLDYLDQLTITQIRVLYEIFASLALNKPIESADESAEAEITFESGLLSDMRIIVRKQLGSNDPKFKQMGVLGAISLIKRLASINIEDDSTSTSGARGVGMSSRSAANSRSQVTGPTVSCTVAINFVLQIFRSCEHSSIQCISLLFDELSFLISKAELHPKFVSWISESFSSTFIENYLICESDIAARGENGDGGGIFLIPTKPETWFRINKKALAKKNNESPDMIPETEPSDIVHATIMEYAEEDEEEEDSEQSCVNVYPLSEWYYSPKEKRPLPEPAEGEEEEERGQMFHEKQLLMLLPACFKFLQSVELNNNGALDEIGMVLDMGVLMFESEGFERAVLDSEDGLQFCGVKCLKRITNILELQEMLDKLLPDVPRWAPVGFFRDGETNDEELIFENQEPSDEEQEDAATAATVKKTQKSRKGKGKQKVKIQARFSKVVDLKPILRELELDVFNLLSCSYLKLPTSEALEARNVESEEEAVIHFPELLYLFSELHFKLEFLTGSTNTAKHKSPLQSIGLLGSGSVGFSILTRMDTKDIISNVLATVPALCTGLEAAYSELRNGMEGVDKDDFEPKEKSYIKTLEKTFDVIIKCFRLIFQWPALKNNDVLFLALLKSISSRGNPEVQGSTASSSNGSPATQARIQILSKLLVDCHDYFIAFKTFIPSLPSVMLLVKLLVEIHHSCVALPMETLNQLKDQTSCLAKENLNTEWDEKKNMNESITFLLQTQIENSKKPFEVISDYTYRAFKALLSGDGNICAKYPLLNMTTFPLFFKIVFVELVALIEKSDTPQASATAEYIARVTRLAAAFSAAVDLSKQGTEGKHYSILLKYSKNFIQSFVKRAIPIFNKGLKKFRAEIVGAFKALQNGTRLLQVISNECKARKDTALLSHIPPLRKALEALIFEVKKMLVDNDLGEAFFMANLKHKNLKGETISSQIDLSDQEDETRVESDSDEGDEDQIDERPARPAPKKRRTPERDEEEASSGGSKNEDELEEQQDDEEAEEQVAVVIDEEEEDDEEM
ncbi:UNVERIFIED_CONTAM: Fanconi anemia group D2 protein, partial [Siphonaria sp. JEL0065]